VRFLRGGTLFVEPSALIGASLSFANTRT